MLTRKATYGQFKDADKSAIDTGIIIYFSGPNSFTGEDIVELQGHGSPIIQDLVLKRVISLGARQARAGEFSERAFLNDRIDLAQAEAIADLINSSTIEAAKGAMRSLQGQFSKRIDTLLSELIHVRMYVEAAIDFPEEEIDFLADIQLRQKIDALQTKLKETIMNAGQGAILRSGFKIVLAGKPNAGKSSLLNALAGHEAAIVTDIPGTTRDVVSETIDIDGLPVHILDTAGLRESDNQVEKIGIERARTAMEQADHVLEIIDISSEQNQPDLRLENVTPVYNKKDLSSTAAPNGALLISATSGEGVEQLREYIKQLAGYSGGESSTFTARRRHLTALRIADSAVNRGVDQLTLNNAGELLADELLQAQNALNEITGEFNADDLLGEIFSGFCIGK